MIDSRLARDGGEIRRRRECVECGRRFTTRERVDDVLPKVFKRDARREDFQREKLVAAIQNACAKRPVSADVVERLAERVERVLQELGEKEVPSRAIGEADLHLFTNQGEWTNRHPCGQLCRGVDNCPRVNVCRHCRCPCTGLSARDTWRSASAASVSSTNARPRTRHTGPRCRVISRRILSWSPGMT